MARGGKQRSGCTGLTSVRSCRLWLRLLSRRSLPRIALLLSTPSLDLPETANTGRKAVLKVWCMPIDKVHGTFSWRCSNTAEGAKAVQFLLAQQKVMEECGLLDVTIKVRRRVRCPGSKHWTHGTAKG